MVSYTVLFLLPSWYVDDKACAADSVTRVHVEAPGVDEAVELASYEESVERNDRVGAESDQELEERRAKFQDELEPIAVYEGRLFDLYLC